MANSADRLVWPQEGVSRVPYRVFSDPDIFRDEQARIFHGAAWNFVGLEIEVPEKGDFRTHYVGDTPVILTRDHDGGSMSWSTAAPTRGTWSAPGFAAMSSG